MDLLFNRYASPYLLLDQIIRSRRLTEFVDKFVDDYNERHEWEFYLHRYIDKSFGEFRESLRATTKTKSNENLETIISDSQDILSDFIPN
jgi:hypothetical protein